MTFFNKDRQRNMLITLAVFAATYVSFQILSDVVPYSISFNTTPSIPTGLYFQEKLASNHTIARDQYYCFVPPEHDWMKGRDYNKLGIRFCKRVVGLPDDTIKWEVNKKCGLTAQYVIYREDKSFVCMGTQRELDSKGRAVPKALPVGIIPEGKYVMRGDNSKVSLDSRYLGLIDKQTITYRVAPLWTN
jgi:conjugative transfer signal peptidase TraF